MSAPDLPRDPFERGTDGATGYEDARLVWRALAELPAEQWPAALNALDADDLRWAVLVRLLFDRAEEHEEADR